MLHLYRSFVDGNLSGKPISWREVHNALGREFRHDRHSRFYDFRRMMAAAQARERDHHAARSIQALHRGSSVRTGIHKDKTVTVLQARHRGNAVRAQHQQKLDAAVRIQVRSSAENRQHDPAVARAALGEAFVGGRAKSSEAMSRAAARVFAPSLLM